MWGRRVCQWSDRLPRSSHTPPVSVPPGQRESSPLRCLSPPLLPVWMNVYFLFPWCWTSLPFDFLSVLVVRGGAVCLPTPPSWFSRMLFLAGVDMSVGYETSIAIFLLGAIFPPWGRWVMPGDIFVCLTGSTGCYWNLIGRGHRTMHKTAHNKEPFHPKRQ